MKIIRLYEAMRENGGNLEAFLASDPEGLAPLAKVLDAWDVDGPAMREWLASADAIRQRPVAHAYAARAAEIVRIVETAFGRELPGLLVLSPSFGDLDGFARYESGSHTVFLGIDFPEADVPYLQALTAHELSHVYRDHSPRVWAHLGKPLSEISRAEYLDEGTAAEHLVSEGLATLFSMTLFPEIPGATHHYYSAEEYEWCRTNRDRIESAIRACLVRDQNVWSFYGEGRAGPGSPSRTQYFWAADVLTEKMNRILAAREAIVGEDPLREVVALHALPAAEFLEFV